MLDSRVNPGRALLLSLRWLGRTAHYTAMSLPTASRHQPHFKPWCIGLLCLPRRGSLELMSGPQTRYRGGST